MPTAPDEIDLMKYYSDEYYPADYYTRVVAAAEDTMGLISVCEVEFEAAP